MKFPSLLLVLSLATSPILAQPLQNEVSITTEGEQRLIHSNGIPDHPTGVFPNRSCPNTIAPQQYSFKMPLHPQAAASDTKLGMHPFGVAVNGVVLDPGAAEWWQRNPSSGWQYEPLSGKYYLGTDDSNAHVQPNGAYHYHGIPNGLIKKRNGENKMIQVGWAADGYPIYGPWGYSDPKNAQSEIKKLKPSYQVKNGVRPNGPGGKYDGTFIQDYEYAANTGDLDENNGRFGVTPEFPEGTYHYYITDGWPFIPRSFKSTPDSSFFRKGPPGGPGRGPMRRGGPPPFPPPPFPPPPPF